jgi:hypothetical protein
MLIPGVPNEHLEGLQRRRQDGRGALGYRHVPSGIVVSRPCQPDVPVHVINAEALAELAERLATLATGGEPNARCGWSSMIRRPVE